MKSKLQLPVLFLLLTVLGAASLQAQEAGQWEVERIQGRGYVRLDQVQAVYAFRPLVREGDTLGFESATINVGFIVGSADVTINGLRFVLEAPIISSKEKTYISVGDLTGLLDPALRPMSHTGKGTIKAVILDAGSGLGEAASSHALNIAAEVKRQLEKHGLKVVMTRTDRSEPSLEDRISMAEELAENSIFVGISFNSGPADAKGVETFSHRRAEGEGGTEVMDSASVALATSVHGSVLRALGAGMTGDRGIRRESHELLARIHHPAVIVNAGNVGNPEEAAMIATAAYQASVASAIVEGVRKYQLVGRRAAGAPGE